MQNERKEGTRKKKEKKFLISLELKMRVCPLSLYPAPVTATPLMMTEYGHFSMAGVRGWRTKYRVRRDL